jgi:hypothetical protein
MVSKFGFKWRYRMKKIILGFLIATLLFATTSFAFAENKTEILSKIYQNTLGDVFKVFDKESHLQVKLGSANTGGDNIGGTLILYNNDESKPRVSAGVREETDSGIVVLYDKNNKGRLYLSAEQTDFLPGLFLYDDSGKCTTAIRQTYGYINNQPIVTQDKLLQEIAKLQKQIDELKGAN